jgi:hypothetical protein
MPLTNTRIILAAGAMASTNVLTSEAIAVDNQNLSLQLVWSGTPTGSFSIQVSNDGVTWTPVTLSSSPVAAGAADSAVIAMSSLGSAALRVVYTNASGTGVLNITASRKGLS